MSTPKITNVPVVHAIINDETALNAFLNDSSPKRTYADKQMGKKTLTAILSAMALGHDDEADFLLAYAGVHPAYGKQTLNNRAMAKKKDAAKDRLREKLKQRQAKA